MQAEELAKTIDHTLLKPNGTEEQIRQLCAEAREFSFATVCVNPSFVPLVAELLAGTLRRHGVDWMSTLCGHGLDPLFHAARKAGIRLVDTRNEQTAAYMADAYGRLTRRVGVCAVSSGVAHINALSGVANAWFDGAPMLLVSGAAMYLAEGEIQPDKITVRRGIGGAAVNRGRLIEG